MVDKIKPLKIENPSLGGTQDDPFPTETNPTQDYGAFKGISFENSDDFLIDKIGKIISCKMPDTWQKATYLGNGQLSYLEFFSSTSFITANRIAKVSLTYDSNLQPVTEIAVIYDTDGTTILRTITHTFTFSALILQSFKSAVT